jgi:hypothetical protein
MIISSFLFMAEAEVTELWNGSCFSLCLPPPCVCVSREYNESMCEEQLGRQESSHYSWEKGGFTRITKQDVYTESTPRCSPRCIFMGLWLGRGGGMERGTKG